MTSKPPTFVVVAVTAGPKPPGPRPSASMLTKIVAGPCPFEGDSYATAIWSDGPTAMSPKLPPLEPVEDAPR